MLIMQLAAIAAASGTPCTSAAIDAHGGIVRTTGAHLTVPAGLWSGARTVSLCPTGTDKWAVHLPIRTGTGPRLQGGVTVHIDKQPIRSATDILFTLDRSCSMNSRATVNVAATTDPAAPVVEWVTPHQPSEMLQITVVRRTTAKVTVSAAPKP
ncbi:MAG: hypothetical protein AAF211_25730 [Myxococcota bacterium]